MHTSTFFRLFPPPKFLAMKHAGLDISDDAIHLIEYGHSSRGLVIDKYDHIDLPTGTIEGGDIKNETVLKDLLTSFNKKNKLLYVKVSLPEEKAYLFQTDVPSADTRVISQNIEFKLEENVPLSAADSVFYFDLMPASFATENLRASVSVVPRAYVEQLISILRHAGMSPVAFEVIPKAIARAVLTKDQNQTYLIVHIMDHKTGLYVVSDGVVCFTSTVTSGGNLQDDTERQVHIVNLSREINRVYSYWQTHGGDKASITDIVLTGRQAIVYENPLHAVLTEIAIPVHVAHIWNNVFDINHYVPPISHDTSLEYVVAAGLAITNLH